MTDLPPHTDPIEDLRHQILQLQIDSIKRSNEDHERRLRILEETATKFNFLLYLTAGGGLLSLFNLISIVFLIKEVAGR